MDGMLTFAGYKVPHPLRDEMVLRIGVEDASEDKAREAIAEAAKALADMFTEWTADWQRSLQVSGIKLPNATEPPKKVWNAYADGKKQRATK
jgi:hypothetical protein